MIVSIILPTYKPAYYIYECINSINKQTFDKNLFELIIVLNGCNEPYYSDINQYIQNHLDKDLVVNFIQTDQSGVSNARNIGLDIANGEYITFIDDDDYITKNYLESLYEILLLEEEKDQSNVIACSNYKTFSKDTLNSDYLTKAHEKCYSYDYNIIKYRSFLSNVTGKLIPKSVIENIRFNKNLYISEDAIFMFEISKNIKKMILTNSKAYYVRRIRQESASNTKRSKSEVFYVFRSLIVRYTNIYIKSPLEYNFLLYVTRILAASRNLIKQIQLY